MLSGQTETIRCVNNNDVIVVVFNVIDLKLLSVRCLSVERLFVEIQMPR